MMRVELKPELLSWARERAGFDRRGELELHPARMPGLDLRLGRRKLGPPGAVEIPDVRRPKERHPHALFLLRARLDDDGLRRGHGTGST